MLTLVDEQPHVVDRVDSVEAAVRSMARYALEWGQQLNVAIGNAHRDGWPIAEALAAALGGTANVREVIHFRIGASVGVGTGAGPGAVGCVMFPA